jgi:hypothetical protein
MNEEELRELVRDAVARHLASGTPDPGLANAPPGDPSFHRYRLPSGGDGEGPCLIEPAVRCTHCGYCQSHGY